MKDHKLCQSCFRMFHEDEIETVKLPPQLFISTPMVDKVEVCMDCKKTLKEQINGALNHKTWGDY